MLTESCPFRLVLQVHQQRAQKLKFLLQRSGVYAKIMSEKMEKERKTRGDQAGKSKQGHANGNGNGNVKPEEDEDEDDEGVITKGVAKGVTAGRSTRAGDADEKKAANGAASEVRPKREKAGKRKTEEDDFQVSNYLTKEDLKSAPSGSSTPDSKKMRSNTGTPVPRSHLSSANIRQPALITGAELRDYQLDGYEWLVSLYENGLNGILADEMGLGKTLQTISFLAHLRAKGVWGPFLIVAPLSTIANWVNEFERFAPGIPAMMYHAQGGKTARAELRKRLRFPTTSEEKKAFPVVVTSFEVAIMDRPHLSHLKWKYIVVDEGHRLKNMNCKLIQELKRFKSAQRLILTGTPLHNNLKELWSLLNFILPDIFDDLETFEKWFDFSDISDEGGSNKLLSREDSRNVITQLHSILKPFLLRRLKTDVETNLPPKKEYLLYAPLTSLQRELYEGVIHGTIRKWLLERKTKLPFSEIQSLLREGGNTAAQEDLMDISAGPSSRASSVGTDGPSSRAGKGRKARKSKVTYNEDESENQFLNRLEMEADEADDEPEPISLDEREKEGKLYAIRKAQKEINNMKLGNLFMQCRKICCHPYLFDWPKEPNGEMLVDKSLVTASGKMLMLNRLLDALFAKKHKVLIFSQFTTILDIIEDWAGEYKNLKTCRIDGTTTQEDRRQQMKSFNEDTSDDSVKLFLLSTRAGGLGINLVAADTVIFYDSDWNPQMDLQAQDRVHRIGQTKPVLIFRLVSANTVESRLLKRAGDKRKLEAIVIKKGEFQLPPGASTSSTSDIFKGKSTDKQESMQEMARSLLALEGEKVQVAEENDEIISDGQLEMLLDRSSATYEGRKMGWSDGNDAFEVTETAADGANEDLAKLMNDM